MRLAPSTLAAAIAITPALAQAETNTNTARTEVSGVLEGGKASKDQNIEGPETLPLPSEPQVIVREKRAVLGTLDLRKTLLVANNPNQTDPLFAPKQEITIPDSESEASDPKIDPLNEEKDSRWSLAGFVDFNTSINNSWKNWQVPTNPRVNQAAFGVSMAPIPGKLSAQFAVAGQFGDNLKDLSPRLEAQEGVTEAQLKADGVLRHIPILSGGIVGANGVKITVGMEPNSIGLAGSFTQANFFNAISLHQNSVPNYNLGANLQLPLNKEQAVEFGLLTGWQPVGGKNRSPVIFASHRFNSHKYNGRQWSLTHSVLMGPVNEDTNFETWRGVGESKVQYAEERIAAGAVVNVGMEHKQDAPQLNNSIPTWCTVGLEGVFQPFKKAPQLLMGVRDQLVIDRNKIVMPQPGIYNQLTAATAFKPKIFDGKVRAQLEYNYNQAPMVEMARDHRLQISLIIGGLFQR